MSISTAKLEANRANAQLSTGPTSPEGKAKVSLNAVKSGLTGRTVLLPTDDVAAYEKLIAELSATWKPATPEEERLTQALVDTEWRLARIPELETGILALGYRELAHEFADIENESARRGALTAKVYLTYVRPLNNLVRQEARLRRMREKDTAALKQLQAERKQAAADRLDHAARLYMQAVADETNQDWKPSEFGFELSMDEIETRALELDPHLFDEWFRQHPEELEWEADDEDIAA